MSTQEKEQWFVAVKMFLRDGENLLILKDIFDDGWDLPGGRIRKNEFETPLPDIVARKMREEVGKEVVYKLNETPKIFFRHERTEAETGETVRIFAIGYEATYTSGTVTLGKHMDRYEWVDAKIFNAKDYFRGGWLKGVEEYQTLQK